MSEVFKAGEIARVWRTAYPLDFFTDVVAARYHGTECEVLMDERICPSCQSQIYAIETHDGLKWLHVPRELLRKLPPPGQVVSWDRCSWRPTRERNAAQVLFTQKPYTVTLPENAEMEAGLRARLLDAYRRWRTSDGL